MAVLFASILDSDWENLPAEIKAVELAGVDGFSIDVMDGRFVPRVTFGPETVRLVKENSSLPVEAHLMASGPEALAEECCAAGADQITIHLEAVNEPLALVRRVHALGALAGLAVLQETPMESIPDELFAELDALNLMAVPVGYGGGAPSPELPSRVKAARQRAEALNPGLVIEIDGGMKPQNCGEYVEAGADLIVMGTGIYKAPDYAAAVGAARRNLAPEDAVSGRRTARIRKKAKNV